MNIEYFISKKLFSTKEKNKSYTKPILRIAIFAIALSLSVMLLALIIVSGFKNTISSKIIGFGSHITISKSSDNISYESVPISTNQDFLSLLYNNNEIKNINVFATKAAIIKTKNDIHGIILKGVSSDYDWKFFNSNLVAGECLDINNSLKSNDIMISDDVSKLLHLGLGDELVMYFIQNPARIRKFNIKGIYSTAMVEFDKLYVLGDIKHIQDLNSWDSTQVGGFEVAINNFADLDAITNKIQRLTPYYIDAQNIKQKTPQIFDWLDLQDMNVKVILILMIIVGVINMITALLILILEKTSLIGMLKALGATNWSIRKVFLYCSLNLILKGLILGNLITFIFALLQKRFSIISLDPSIYYMTTIPIDFNFTHIIFLNLFTIIICYLILIIPSIIISKITPIKAIRFV